MTDLAKEEYCHSFPARVLHWLNAANIGLLTITGLYIRDPVHFALFANMDIARKAHFVAMYLIIFGILVRIYYSYVSGDYRELLFRPNDIRGLFPLMKYYLFLSKSTPGYGKYNPGQKLLYNAWGVMVFIQAFTGFILYWPDMLAGTARILGGPVIVRQVHFLMTWVFTATVALHVYLSFIGGWKVIKSMITGYFPEGESMQPVSQDLESKDSLPV